MFPRYNLQPGHAAPDWTRYHRIHVRPCWLVQTPDGGTVGQYEEAPTPSRLPDFWTVLGEVFEEEIDPIEDQPDRATAEQHASEYRDRLYAAPTVPQSPAPGGTRHPV